MGGAHNWRIEQDLSDWMRGQEKRTLSQERRPSPTARALGGPGFGPFASEIADWNGEDALYTGHFYGPTFAQNSPDNSYKWLGHTLSVFGEGRQELVTFGENVPLLRAVRKFWTPVGAQTPVFEAWNADTEWTPVVFENGYNDYSINNHPVQYRKWAGKVEFRGFMAPGTPSATAFTLPPNLRPSKDVGLAAAVSSVTTGAASAGTPHTHSVPAAGYAFVQDSGAFQPVPYTGWMALDGLVFDPA